MTPAEFAAMIANELINGTKSVTELTYLVDTYSTSSNR